MGALETDDFKFFDGQKVTTADFLATLTELTARQIARACLKYGGSKGVYGTDDVVMRGGVCHNAYFMERLKENMNGIDINGIKRAYTGVCAGNLEKIKTLDDLGLDEDSWENAMYALF